MFNKVTRKPIVFILEKSSTKYKAPNHFHKEIIPYLKKNNINLIVDFAAGKYLVLTKILLKYFSKVFIVETKNQIEEILKKFNNLITIEKVEILTSESFLFNKNRYEAIILANVLHIIPFEEERKTLLLKIAEKLTIGGFLYIKTSGKSIPSINSSNKGNKYSDGYYFKFKTLENNIYATFRTGFTMEKLLSYIPEVLKVEKKFIVNSKELSIMFKRCK